MNISLNFHSIKYCKFNYRKSVIDFMKLFSTAFFTLAFTSCAKTVSYDRAIEMELTDGIENETRWIYFGTDGYNHKFIKFYKSPFGNTSYERINIPISEMTVKLNSINPPMPKKANLCLEHI